MILTARAMGLAGCVFACGGGREQPPHAGTEVLVANPRPNANYSPAVRARGLVFLAGMVGIDPTTNALTPGGVGPQTSTALARIQATLREAGLGLADVAKCTVYLADMADYERMNEAYRVVWPGPPPARTTVQAVPPMGAAVEIECVAALP